jgi:hypothetical protein
MRERKASSGAFTSARVQLFTLSISQQEDFSLDTFDLAIEYGASNW